MFKASQFKFQKKFFAFFTVVPLLMASAVMQAPCPVCQSTGDISTGNMRWVSITDIKATTGGIYLALCSVFRVYPTDITLTLTNHSDDDATGYINLVLVDYQNGLVISHQYVLVTVPANKRVEAVYNVYFQTYVDDPLSVKVDARVVTGEIPCKACDGTGKVALNSAPFLTAMKDHLTKAEAQIEYAVPFQPLFIAPEDWDVPYAYDMEVYDYFSQ
ncbi:MAG: hypothetical protein FWH51_03915 [Dehalococcoidia bacterium]|nr:hypothetical protein [Dehalococcoidia bacterium]MCL2150061.1 hypothetical protein [Dehalococcoidia bacterium]